MHFEKILFRIKKILEKKFLKNKKNFMCIFNCWYHPARYPIEVVAAVATPVIFTNMRILQILAVESRTNPSTGKMAVVGTYGNISAILPVTSLDKAQPFIGHNFYQLNLIAGPRAVVPDDAQKLGIWQDQNGSWRCSFTTLFRDEAEELESGLLELGWVKPSSKFNLTAKAAVNTAAIEA